MESGGGSPYHGMQPMGTSEPVSPYSDGPVEVRERPFIVGLLLTIVTFGVYGWYWHYKTHDELSRQMGRDNQAKGIWFGYMASAALWRILLIVLSVRLAEVMFDARERGMRNGEEVMQDIFVSHVGISLAFAFAYLLGLVFLTAYVIKQYGLIREARSHLGLPAKPDMAWFFGFYFGSLVANFIVGIAYYIGAPVAYHNLQEHYNEIHRVVAGKQSVAPTDAQAPPGHAERYQEGQGFGTSPTASGYERAANAPAYGGPGTPHTYYGSGGTGQHAPQRPTWGAPSTQGYRIGERTTGGPGREAPQVEQTFRCPRCHGHVTARGPAGGEASIQCAQCGEGGLVRLPE
ncbi:MAG: DUF4234 domain-containing protein [Euryarchaeota archaeon]|nr:DUF4234 domain-containing protein [Euryarchaeota archaeon]